MAAGVVAAAFLVTAIIVIGLRFEHAMDASGGTRQARAGLIEGVKALARRPVLRWSMVGVYGQVLTRGLLNPLMVVAAIELLGMGEGGVGLLSAALGLGGFVGAVFAVNLTRADQLVRTESAALAYWGAPIAVIGLFVHPAVGLAAMVVTGVANAVYDVAIITIFQRGATEPGTVGGVLGVRGRRRARARHRQPPRAGAAGGIRCARRARGHRARSCRSWP